MEAASENTQEKAKRGRPRSISAEYMAALHRIWPELRTDRDMANKRYMTRALNLLWEDTQFQWLCDKAQMHAGTQNSFRPGILSELGRIWNDDDMRTVALQVCELKPKTKVAIALIRRWRLGKEPALSRLHLLASLERMVNDYARTHHAAPWDDVEWALINLFEAVRELKGGKEK